MTLEQTKDYLDTLPGVLALFWFMENVSEDYPDRTALFFYCRERVRRYQPLSTKHYDCPYRAELSFDLEMFERIKKEQA